MVSPSHVRLSAVTLNRDSHFLEAHGTSSRLAKHCLGSHGRKDTLMEQAMNTRVCRAYNFCIWRTSCEAPLVLPISRNPALLHTSRPPVCRRCKPMARAPRWVLTSALAVTLVTIFSCGTCPPVPSITSISPASATAGGSQFLLTVKGNDFRHDSVCELERFPSGDELRQQPAVDCFGHR
jgi:hypothetical protein